MYYPGCTVKRNAIEYERSAIAILNKLGINVIELPKWYCCGALYSLATDNLAKHLGAVRTLISAEESAGVHKTNRLLTLCPMCFNVLKRVHILLKNDPEKLGTINQYLGDENKQYRGTVDVIHVVEILRDRLADLKKLVKRKLDSVKVTVYYGCTIVRPKEIGVDNPDDPRIIEDILRELGLEVVDLPFKTYCCGAYHILDKPNIVYGNSSKILRHAIDKGASIIVTVCPLCLYNLEATLEKTGHKPTIRVMYLTELIAYILGLDGAISKINLDYLNKFFQSSLHKNS
ncbi:MAG: heterodisulfide reductase-related iron-sulfur binding cluster [Thermoprotei archaeon]